MNIRRQIMRDWGLKKLHSKATLMIAPGKGMLSTGGIHEGTLGGLDSELTRKQKYEQYSSIDVVKVGDKQLMSTDIRLILYPEMIEAQTINLEGWYNVIQRNKAEEKKWRYEIDRNTIARAKEAPVEYVIMDVRNP